MNHSTWYRGRPHLEYLVNKTPFCVIYNLNFFGENFIVATCYKGEGKLIRQCWELAVGINGSLSVKGSLLAQVFLQCSVWCQAFFSVSPYLIHLSKLLYSHFPLSSKQVAEYIYIYIFFLTEILKCNGAWWWLLTRLLWLSSVAHPCDSWSLLCEIPNTICDLPKIFNIVLLDW